MTLTVFMPKIIGKARPRVTVHGTYTPKPTRDAEELIRREAETIGITPEPADVPLRLSVTAVFPVAQSWTKTKKRLAYCGAIPICKPDADNILKLVADALNGVAYEDDKQIAEMCCVKRYVRSERDQSRLEITITDISP